MSKPNFKKSNAERPPLMRTLSEVHLPECAMRDRNLDAETRLYVGCTCGITNDAPDWTR